MAKSRPRYPNRIREIRIARGLSAEKLGESCGTSQQQIQRLETGERRLTQGWMEKIAKALRIAPADLLPGIQRPGQDDVVHADLGVPGVASAMAAKGLYVYRVVTDALSAIGIESGQIITIDQSDEATASLNNGAVVLVAIRTGESINHVLRQYFAPRAYLTNPKTGAIAIALADDPISEPTVVGVRITNGQ